MGVKQILIICLILYIYLQKNNLAGYFDSEYIFSSLDQQIHSVISKYSDKDTASDMIAEINIFCIQLMNKLKEVYVTNTISDSRDYIMGSRVVQILFSNYNSSNLKENDPVDPKYTSYTVNKGTEIAICLREKQTGENKFHDMHIIKYVILHELAHVISVGYDHSDEFWTNFKFLLQFCEKYKLYQSTDYTPENTINYCGLIVKYNPVYDDSIMSYF